MKKRYLAFLLSLLLMLSAFPTGVFAAGYTDTNDHWAEAAIDRWSGYGVVQGDGTGFNPNGEMTRAQAATVFANLLKLENTEGALQFEDVAPDAWYADAFAKASAAGIINGTSATAVLASPDAVLTRETFFTMFARAVGIQPQTTTSGLQSDGADWSRGYINALTDKGYVKGDGTGVNALAEINRASVMSLLDQSISTYVNSDGASVTAEGEKMTLVVAKNVTVSGNITDLAIVGGSAGGTITLENATVTGTVTVDAVSDLSLTGTTTVTEVKLTDRAEKATVTVAKDAMVATLSSDANGVNVAGEGKVENADIRGNNNAVNTVGTRVNAADGASGTTGNGIDIKSGTSVTTRASAALAGRKGGGSTGGGNSGGSIGGSNSGGSSDRGGKTDSAPRNLEITSDQTIESGTYSNVKITASVKNGTVSLKGVKIEGDLTIEGGGSNSIKLDNVSIGGKVIINKDTTATGATETPRLELTNTPVKTIEADQAAIIEATDTSKVETITVPTGKTVEVTVKNTMVETIEAKGTTTVKVDNAKIGTGNGSGIVAEGETTVKAADNANPSTIAKVTATKNVSIETDVKAVEVPATASHEVTVTVKDATIDKVEAKGATKIAADNSSSTSTIKEVAAAANVTVAAANTTIEQVTVRAASTSQAVTVTAQNGTIDKIEAKTETVVTNGSGTGKVGTVTVSAVEGMAGAKVIVDSGAVEKVDFASNVSEVNIEVKGGSALTLDVGAGTATVAVKTDAEEGTGTNAPAITVASTGTASTVAGNIKINNANVNEDAIKTPTAAPLAGDITLANTATSNMVKLTVSGVTNGAKINVYNAQTGGEKIVNETTASTTPVEIDLPVATVKGEVYVTVTEGTNLESYRVASGNYNELTFAYSSALNVPAGVVKTAVMEIDFSAANVVSGGIKPYSFDVTTLPQGLTFNAETGKLIGTRPATKAPASTATVTVTDAAGLKKSVTINIGAVKGAAQQEPSLSVTAPTEANGNGKINTLTTAMEISTDGGINFTSVTSTQIAGVAPGTYYVRLAATDALEASKAVSVTVPAYTAPVKDEALAATDAVGVVDLGWSQFVVVRFAKGYSLENVSLLIDGVDVSAAFTPVTDDGSIVKWELEYLNPGTLTAVAKDGGARKTVEITKSGTYDGSSKPTGKTNTSPGYMIAHGPVAIWDYYLTNYDKNGNVRVEPAKTTFNITGGVAATDAPAAWSPDTEMDANGNGTVVIMFNKRTDAEQAWFDAIENSTGSVQLVAFNDELNTLNDHLTFTKQGNVPHAANNYVNEILINLGQDNFRTNERYYIRVVSKGHDTVLVPIHVVNETAPTLSLSGSGTIVSGQNLSFAISNMVYGIQNPIYAVDLTRPDGETVALTEINDFYQIGDTLFVYNYVDEANSVRAGLSNNIPYNGTYTMTVHSHGFKDMSIAFTVVGGTNPPVKSAAWKSWENEVDAVSSATYSGGTTSGDGSGGGGGQQVSADLKFNADLLINALILDRIGVRLDAAKSIVDRWESDMAGCDSVSAADTTLGGFDWSKYITAVTKALTEGKYLSFADYASANADLEKATIPHAVKSVLEDNMLGDIQYYGGWIGKDVPELALVRSVTNTDNTVRFVELTEVLVGEDIVLLTTTAEGIAYLKAIQSVNLNGNSADLSADADYVFGFSPDKDNATAGYLKISPKKQNLTANAYNVILLDATGYKDARLRIFCANDMERNVKATAGKASYERGEDVVITVTGDDGGTKFAAAVTTATITKPSGKTTTIAGTDAYGTKYIRNGTSFTIPASLFDENGTYMISLTGGSYNAVTTTFAVTGTLKTPPAWNLAVSKETDSSNPAKYYYLLNFGAGASGSGLSAYKGAITAITVNGVVYEAASVAGVGGITRQQYDWPSQTGNDVVLRLYGATVFKTGENTIVIYASGYETLTLTLNVDGETLTLGGKPQKPADAAAPTSASAAKQESSYKVTFTISEGYDLDAYLRAVKTVVVGNETYSTASGTAVGSKVTLGITDNAQSSKYDYFTLPIAGIEYGNHTAVIHAEGYADLSVTLSGGEAPAKVSPTAATATLSSDKKNYELTLTYTGTNDELAAFIEAVEISKIEITKGGKTETVSAELNGKLMQNDNGTLYFSADLVEAYEAVNEVTLSAEGYTDVVVTIDNSANALAEPPVVQSVEKSQWTANYNVSFGNTDSGKKYASAIGDTITVGGVEYKDNTSVGSVGARQFTKSAYEITLPASALPTTDDPVEVTIIATGYKPLTFKVDKDGKLVKEGGEEPEPEEGAEDALSVVKTEKVSKMFYDTYYVVSFREVRSDTVTEADVKAYRNKITKVQVGETQYSKGSYVTGTTWMDEDDDSYSEAIGIRLSTGGFDTTGDTEVTITATGYKTLTFTVDKDGKLKTDGSGSGGGVTEPSSGKDVPSYTWTYVSGYYDSTLSFSSGYEYVSNWLSGGGKVYVNDTEWTYVTYGSNRYTTNASSYDDSTIKLYNVPVSSTITITKEGYKDLVITLDASGNEVKASTGGETGGGTASGETGTWTKIDLDPDSEDAYAEAGKIYVFVYEVGGKTYLLSGNDTALTGTVTELTGSESSVTLSKDVLWVASVASSYYGTWNLKNSQSGYCLSYSASGWSVAPNLDAFGKSGDGAWKLDNDGSVWASYNNGYQQLYTTNGADFSCEAEQFTKFTPYVFTPAS